MSKFTRTCLTTALLTATVLSVCGLAQGGNVEQRKQDVVRGVIDRLGRGDEQAPFLAAASHAKALIGLSLERKGENVSLKLECEGCPEFKVSTIRDGRNVVVDLVDTVYIDAGKVLPALASTPVERVRTSLFTIEPQLTSRIVIDLSSPVVFESKQEGGTIEVILAPTSASPAAPLTAPVAPRSQKQTAPTAPIPQPLALQAYHRLHAGVDASQQALTTLANSIRVAYEANAEQLAQLAAPEATREDNEPNALVSAESPAQDITRLAQQLESVRVPAPESASVRPSSREPLSVPTLVGLEEVLPASLDTMNAFGLSQLAQVSEDATASDSAVPEPPAKREDAPPAGPAQVVDRMKQVLTGIADNVRTPAAPGLRPAPEQAPVEPAPEAPPAEEPSPEAAAMSGQAPVEPAPEAPPAEGPSPEAAAMSGQAPVEPAPEAPPAEGPSPEAVAISEKAPVEPAPEAPPAEEPSPEGQPTEEAPAVVEEAPAVEEPPAAIPAPVQEAAPAPAPIPASKPVAPQVPAVPAALPTLPVFKGNPMEQIVDIDFRDMELTNVVAILAAKAGINVIAGADLTGTVTASLRGVTLRQAMDTALRMNGLGMVEEEGIYHIIPYQEAIQAKRVTRMVKLENAKVDDVRKTLEDVLRGSKDDTLTSLATNADTNVLVIAGPENRVEEFVQLAENLDVEKPVTPTVTEAIKINNAEPQDLLAMVESMLSAEIGKVSADERSRHLIVTDVPIVVEQVRALVTKVDMPVRQVSIDTMVVDAILLDDSQTGIDWIFDSVIETNKRGVTHGSLEQLTSETDSTGGLVSPGTITPSTLAHSITFGLLTGNVDIKGTISAEVSNNNAKLLANPVVVTVENKEARINISSEVPYQELTQSTTGPPVASTAFKDIGIVLTVKPRVTHDDHVVSDIAIKQSDTKSEVNSIPVEDKRETETTLRTRNGQTVFIGGLRRFDDQVQSRKVPLLGDIPVMNFMFRNNIIRKESTELLVFLTCNILPDEMPELSAPLQTAHDEIEYTSRVPDSQADLFKTIGNPKANTPDPAWKWRRGE